MKHLRLMIVAAVALTAAWSLVAGSGACAAPAKAHRVVAAKRPPAAQPISPEQMRVKDLIYACAPEAASLVAWNLSHGATRQVAKERVVSGALAVERHFSEYRNNTISIDAPIVNSAVNMQLAKDGGKGSIVSGSIYEVWAYINCMSMRTKEQLNGAVLITHLR